jgi:acyl-coenzyme A synthetase/AMP-(fatty) acid ligase
VSEPFNLATYFLDRHVASGRGDRIALFAGDRSVSYAELARLANRVGNVLRDTGVRRGQRVLLALSDGDEFVATWYGAQKIGAVTAEVYPFLQPKDYAYYLGYTEAVAVIADAVTLPALREAGAAGLLVTGVPESELLPGERPFRSLVDAASATLAAAPTTVDDIGIWKFTTGSTGAPKACVHTLRSPDRELRAVRRPGAGAAGRRPDSRRAQAVLRLRA